MDYNRPAAVYRLYDTDDNLLYIGLTWSLDQRWREHNREKLWWSEVADKQITWYETRMEAWEEEKYAIEMERPLYNSNEVGPLAGLPPQPSAWKGSSRPEWRAARFGYQIQWYLWRLALQDALATAAEQASPR